MILIAQNGFAIHPSKLTFGEAIHLTAIGRLKPKSNDFFNAVLLGTDEYRKFKPIPDEILKNGPFYAGTLGVIGNKGKKLGKWVETECKINASTKLFIASFDKSHTSLVNVLLYANLLIPDGSPLVSELNSKQKAIRNDEDMGATDRVFLKFNGKLQWFGITSRDGGIFEPFGDENTRSWFQDSAILGLFRRGDGFPLCYLSRSGVDLFSRPSLRLGVAVEPVVN